MVSEKGPCYLSHTYIKHIVRKFCFELKETTKLANFWYAILSFTKMEFVMITYIHELNSIVLFC